MTLSRIETLAEHWQWKQRPEGRESHLNVLADDNGWTGTSVPTEILKDLLQSGTIEDPFIDQHEKNVQWVGEVDWLYRARFTVDHVPGAHEKAVLAFDGLDTFAFVYLNGKLILETEVFFLFDLKLMAEYVS
jgi:beta-mannosidase